MIHFNKKYIINNGNGEIEFRKGGDQFVSAVYNRGTIHAHWRGDVLAGTFIDTVSKGEGLIEFTFSENTLEAKWKGGTDPGPMRGKWEGKISDLENPETNQIINSEINTFQSGYKIKLRVVVQKFDFYANRSLELFVDSLGVENTPYTDVNWRSQSDEVESYWWEQEEEFYEFLYENGLEYTAKEYSDWYEFELTVLNENGEEVFQDIVRG
jgi:hypothetical protein